MAAMRWQDSKPDELLEEALSDLLKDISRKYGDQAAPAAKNQEPAVSVGEEEGYYIIVAELPGVLAEDLKVIVGPGSLTLEGRWQGPGFAEKTSVIHSETRTGYFKRVVDLPGPVKGELSHAQLESGLLEIALPKADTETGGSVDVRL